MKSVKKRPVPESISNEQKWWWSRRSFFKTVLMAGVATQLPLLEACLSVPESIKPLNKKQFRILLRIQDILFPLDEHGPGAKEVNAEQYVIWMLNDTRMDPEENEYLINGIDWLEEECREQTGKSFDKLSEKAQDLMVQFILEKTNWGESWLSVNLTYIFEAMISDPIYGFNEKEAGWQWLEHVPGFPRPELHTMYDAIFETVKSNDG